MFFAGTFKAQSADFVTLHGVVFDILVLAVRTKPAVM
jgi:hypothetical protein